MADGSDDDLMHKADALMRRRRIFVAGANDPDGAEALAAAEASDEDLPLLTEVVEPAAVGTAPSPAVIDVAELRRALANELETWLDRDLPGHIQRVLDGITDQLILQLSEKARSELLTRLQNLIAQESAEPPSSAR